MVEFSCKICCPHKNYHNLDKRFVFPIARLLDLAKSIVVLRILSRYRTIANAVMPGNETVIKAQHLQNVEKSKKVNSLMKQLYSRQ